MPGERGRTPHNPPHNNPTNHHPHHPNPPPHPTANTDAELKRLQGLLEPLERDDSPFTGTQPPKLTRFVDPMLVASVEYTDITRIGTIRHPSYKGLRDDLDPRDVAIDRADVG
jgi:bifunctional non-homologous end joining protein LigD